MSIGMRLFEQRAGEVGEIWHVSHSSLMSHGKWKESHIDHGQYEVAAAAFLWGIIHLHRTLIFGINRLRAA